tara:strand:+ start:1074 stop:2024 length:951 start_codon:yes stop_codon:yes gene_type:complete
MITVEWASEAYYRLLKIRLTEEAIAEEYRFQEMRCPVHLSIGQEAIAVGISLCLSDQDVVFSTHRCHSHYLGKKGDLNGMIAELYGRRTGCTKGLGGSMHLIDDTVGMMGASAIVGGSIPLGVGAALSFKLSKLPHLAVSYFGDGACEEGVFHESMNFAALKQLSVLFVCENNAAAGASPLHSRRPADNIFEHGNVFGIPGYSVDGNDLLAVYETARKAEQHVRSGSGPVLIEAKTYRIMRHVGPEVDYSSGTRSKEEWDRWRANCPVTNFENFCLERNLISRERQENIKKNLQQEIRQAFEFAKSSEPAEHAIHE